MGWSASGDAEPANPLLQLSAGRETSSGRPRACFARGASLLVAIVLQ